MSNTKLDEETFIKQASQIHKPDGCKINVRRIFDVVENIVVNGEAHGPTTLEEHLQLLEHDNMGIFIKIKQLSYQMSTKWSGDNVNHYEMTIDLLRLLTTYEWETKAVLILAAFANNYGDKTIYTKESNKPRLLATSVSILKQITFSPQPNTALDDNNKKELFKFILRLIRLVLELKELSSHVVVSHATDLHKIVRSIIVCASQLSTLPVGDESRIKGELDKLKMRIQKVDTDLQQLLKDCHKEIDESEEEESYVALKHVFSKSDNNEGLNNNNKHVLKLLFNVKDNEEHNKALCKLSGETKSEETTDDLSTEKDVLLLISSGLDISKEMASFLGKFYKECSMSHEMLWIPVVKSSKEFWAKERLNEFETLLGLMGFYSTNDPIKSVGPGLHKFIEQDLFQEGYNDSSSRIGKEPFVVVLDSKGKMVNTNALGMILTWGISGSPFDKHKEQQLWSIESWRTTLIFGNIDPLCQLINSSTTQGDQKKEYIFLCGGNNFEWVQEFMGKISVSSFPLDIEPKVMFVGKNNEVRSSILKAKNMNCLDDVSTWVFWARLKSTLLSRIHYLRKTSSDDKKEEGDKIAKGLKKILAYEDNGEAGGWALMCTKDEVVVCGDGDKMSKVVNEYGMWKENVVKDGKSFSEAFLGYYNIKTFEHHKPGCGLEYPWELQYQKNEKCPDCNIDMYKLTTFTCCHGHE